MPTASVGRIESAKSLLKENDYAYLRKCFADAVVMLRALGLLGEAAHALALVADNFAAAPDPACRFQRAVADLESFAHQVEREQGDSSFKVHDFLTIDWQG